MEMKRIHGFDGAIVELYAPKSGRAYVEVNGETVFEHGRGHAAVCKVFDNVCDGLRKTCDVEEWVKDRERVGDYPDGDEGLDRFVLMREYGDGRLEMLQTSDSFDDLAGLMR